MGGALGVSFRQKEDIFSGIYLEGPAVQVFHGFIETDDLKKPLL
jgi:hypothetical protein